MKKVIVTRIMPITFVILTFLFALSNSIESPKFQTEETTMYVDPTSLTAQLNDNIQINISISNVVDLCSWEFKLFYKNNILSGTKIVEGPFLKSGGDTFFWIQNFTDNYNATHGIVWAACTRLWTGPGVNGSGVLATIDFKAVGGGTTTLHLTDTVLGNSTADPIPHVTVDGNVEVLGGDIAIINVKTSKTIVGQGYLMDINVTVENQGTTTETFNLTAYANASKIETKQITLDSNTSITITFTWNTTGFAKGNYTITAYAWPVPGEADIADNSLTDGWIYISLIGDIMGPDGYPDGKVDIRDVACVSRLFGIIYPDPKYDPNCDFTGPTPGVPDGRIDIRDIAVVAKHFGEIDP